MKAYGELEELHGGEWSLYPRGKSPWYLMGRTLGRRQTQSAALQTEFHYLRGDESLKSQHSLRRLKFQHVTEPDVVAHKNAKTTFFRSLLN